MRKDHLKNLYLTTNQLFSPKYSELQVGTAEHALNIVLFPEGDVNEESLPVGHHGQTEE